MRNKSHIGLKYYTTKEITGIIKAEFVRKQTWRRDRFKTKLTSNDTDWVKLDFESGIRGTGDAEIRLVKQ